MIKQLTISWTKLNINIERKYTVHFYEMQEVNSLESRLKIFLQVIILIILNTVNEKLQVLEVIYTQGFAYNVHMQLTIMGMCMHGT